MNPAKAQERVPAFDIEQKTSSRTLTVLIEIRKICTTKMLMSPCFVVESVGVDGSLRSRAATRGPAAQIDQNFAMHFGKIAKSHLSQHRIALETVHRSLLADLALHPGKPHRDELSEHIERLRSAYREAMIASIAVSRTISRRIDKLNLASAMEALVAGHRLTIVGLAVVETLNQIDRDSGKR